MDRPKPAREQRSSRQGGGAHTSTRWWFLLLWILAAGFGCADKTSAQDGSPADSQPSSADVQPDTRADLAPADARRDADPCAGQRPGAGKIVVLGSSTAYGMGPSDPSNAWVKRYQSYLSQDYPGFSVQNLAYPGFTTYDVQPSDYVPAAGRPAPDPSRNISAALALNPVAILVNLPSNDQVQGWSTDEQMANHRRVVGLAKGSCVPVWVTTTQPRNFPSEAARKNLMEVRDKILQEFGSFAIDFWTGIANPDGTIKAEYNADGTHLNDAGHAILADRVKAAQIPGALLPADGG
jgi:lysophospholipase L1-like esterase